MAGEPKQTLGERMMARMVARNTRERPRGHVNAFYSRFGLIDPLSVGKWSADGRPEAPEGTVWMEGAPFHAFLRRLAEAEDRREKRLSALFQRSTGGSPFHRMPGQGGRSKLAPLALATLGMGDLLLIRPETQLPQEVVEAQKSQVSRPKSVREARLARETPAARSLRLAREGHRDATRGPRVQTTRTLWHATVTKPKAASTRAPELRLPTLDVPAHEARLARPERETPRAAAARVAAERPVSRATRRAATAERPASAIQPVLRTLQKIANSMPDARAAARVDQLGQDLRQSSPRTWKAQVRAALREIGADDASLVADVEHGLPDSFVRPMTMAMSRAGDTPSRGLRTVTEASPLVRAAQQPSAAARVARQAQIARAAAKPGGGTRVRARAQGVRRVVRTVQTLAGAPAADGPSEGPSRGPDAPRRRAQQIGDEAVVLPRRFASRADAPVEASGAEEPRVEIIERRVSARRAARKGAAAVVAPSAHAANRLHPASSSALYWSEAADPAPRRSAGAKPKTLRRVVEVQDASPEAASDLAPLLGRLHNRVDDPPAIGMRPAFYGRLGVEAPLPRVATAAGAEAPLERLASATARRDARGAAREARVAEPQKGALSRRWPGEKRGPQITALSAADLLLPQIPAAPAESTPAPAPETRVRSRAVPAAPRTAAARPARAVLSRIPAVSPGRRTTASASLVAAPASRGGVTRDTVARAGAARAERVQAETIATETSAEIARGTPSQRAAAAPERTRAMDRVGERLVIDTPSARILADVAASAPNRKVAARIASAIERMVEGAEDATARSAVVRQALRDLGPLGRAWQEQVEAALPDAVVRPVSVAEGRVAVATAKPRGLRPILSASPILQEIRPLPAAPETEPAKPATPVSPAKARAEAVAARTHRRLAPASAKLSASPVLAAKPGVSRALSASPVAASVRRAAAPTARPEAEAAASPGVEPRTPVARADARAARVARAEPVVRTEPVARATTRPIARSEAEITASPLRERPTAHLAQRIVSAAAQADRADDAAPRADGAVRSPISAARLGVAGPTAAARAAGATARAGRDQPRTLRSTLTQPDATLIRPAASTEVGAAPAAQPTRLTRVPVMDRVRGPASAAAPVAGATPTARRGAASTTARAKDGVRPSIPGVSESFRFDGAFVPVGLIAALDAGDEAYDAATPRAERPGALALAAQRSALGADLERSVLPGISTRQRSEPRIRSSRSVGGEGSFTLPSTPAAPIAASEAAVSRTPTRVAGARAASPAVSSASSAPSARSAAPASSARYAANRLGVAAQPGRSILPTVTSRGAPAVEAEQRDVATGISRRPRAASSLAAAVARQTRAPMVGFTASHAPELPEVRGRRRPLSLASIPTVLASAPPAATPAAAEGSDARGTAGARPLTRNLARAATVPAARAPSSAIERLSQPASASTGVVRLLSEARAVDEVLRTLSRGPRAAQTRHVSIGARQLLREALTEVRRAPETARASQLAVSEVYSLLSGIAADDASKAPAGRDAPTTRRIRGGNIEGVFARGEPPVAGSSATAAGSPQAAGNRMDRAARITSRAGLIRRLYAGAEGTTLSGAPRADGATPASAGSAGPGRRSSRLGERPRLTPRGRVAEAIFATPGADLGGGAAASAGSAGARGGGGASQRRAARTGLDTTLLSVESGEMEPGSPGWARRTVGADIGGTVGGLLNVLARTHSAGDALKAINRQSGAIRSNKSLPVPMLRLLDEIRDEAAAQALSEAEQAIAMGLPAQPVVRPPRNTRSRHGFTNLSRTERSKGTQGIGADRLMNMVRRLQGLVFLADHQRDEALRQVRLAEDSAAARAEGQAAPTQSGDNRANEVDVDALAQEVMQVVQREMELRSERRQDDPENKLPWW